MTNLELRILSGLHRGAALPLDCAALELGGGEQADVVLADRGLAARHARLVPDVESSVGWRLEPLDGTVFGEFDDTPQPVVPLVPEECARLGDVWICICAPDAPWQDVPEPLPAPPTVQNVANTPAGESVPGSAAAAGPGAPAPKRRASGRLRRVVLLPFGMLIVLCAATAYAFTARPSGPALEATPPAAGEAVPRVPAVAPPAPSEAPLTGARLRAAFERELADGQILERFELRLEDERWAMRADLDGEEKERFERMLARFTARHRIAFPVEVRIVPSAALLPFRIEQVLSGAQAGIVTADGKRLFVGDEYRGTRLVSMKDGRLLFAGKRKIEVQW